jgi:hypothetical protein
VLYSYGSLVGVVMSVFLIWVSNFMGKQFEELQESGQKVGERAKEVHMALASAQSKNTDTSCGLDEEGQSYEPAQERSNSGNKVASV